jgi:hypothetical protein
MTILEHATEGSELGLSSDNYRFKGLFIGHTGSGKSTGALTAPGRKLLLEYENRLEALIGHPELSNTKIIQILERDNRSPSAWDAAEALRRELTALARKKDEPFPYDCIIEDGATALGKFCMNWSLLLDPKRGLGGAPAQHHYGPWIKNFGDHVEQMRNLPCSYILTAHFNVVEDEASGNIKYFPKVFGKQFRTELPGMFNEVYYCTKEDFVEEGTNKHRRIYLWYTGGTGRYDFFKSAINNQDAYWDDPVRVNLTKTPYGIQRLLQLRFQGKEEAADG